MAQGLSHKILVTRQLSQLLQWWYSPQNLARGIPLILFNALLIAGHDSKLIPRVFHSISFFALDQESIAESGGRAGRNCSHRSLLAQNNVVPQFGQSPQWSPSQPPSVEDSSEAEAIHRSSSAHSSRHEHQWPGGWVSRPWADGTLRQSSRDYTQCH